MQKVIIVLYGPPGAGKGTQATLLAAKFNLINIDTGQLLESIVHDPARNKSAAIRLERRLFDAGKLLTPSFVTRTIIHEIKKTAKADWGLVMSGSPRTLYEAKREYPILEHLYGRKNIFVFFLDLPPRYSIKRNSARMVCKHCGYLLLTSFYRAKHVKRCPVCGAPLYQRTIDNAAVIKVRLKEYAERTLPILEFLKKCGYRVKKIDARPAPYKVTERIYAHIKNAR